MISRDFDPAWHGGSPWQGWGRVCCGRAFTAQRIFCGNCAVSMLILQHLQMKTGVAPLLVPTRAGQSCREGAQPPNPGLQLPVWQQSQAAGRCCLMHQSLWWEAWKFFPAPPCVAALLGQDDPCWRSLFMVQFPCAPSLEPSQPELPIPPTPFGIGRLGSRLPWRGCLWKGCGSAVFACKVSCWSVVSLPLLIPRASRGSARFLLPAQGGHGAVWMSPVSPAGPGASGCV